MGTAGIRDFKNNLSKFLRRLKPGQVITITDRGRPVAEVRLPGTEDPASRAVDAYERLIREGIIVPARESGDPLEGIERIGKPAPKGTAAALIDEDRGD